MTAQSKTFSALLVLLLVVATPRAYAEGSTLAQGLDAAWSRQPELRAANLRREAASAALVAARRITPEPPALELNASTDRLTGNKGLRDYGAAVSFPLWLPGQQDRAQAVAATDLASQEQRLAASKARLAGEVREVFWSLQRARIEQELAEQRLASAKRLADDVARRVRAGDLSRADSHQANGAVATAQGLFGEATVLRNEALRQWTALTGLQEEPKPTYATERVPSALRISELHPSLADLGARAVVARRVLDLAKVQVRENPAVVLGTSRERDGLGDRYGQNLIVGVRVPLGTSSFSQSRIAATSADLVEIEQQLGLEMERLSRLVETTQSALNTLIGVEETARIRAQLARESRDFFERSFRAGETDLPQRLRVELEAVEAERQHGRSRIEVGAAVSRLRQALGLLPESP